MTERDWLLQLADRVESMAAEEVEDVAADIRHHAFGCKCSMRDGAHETTCNRVGEYDGVHCKRCDLVVPAFSVSLGLCTACCQLVYTPFGVVL